MKQLIITCIAWATLAGCSQTEMETPSTPVIPDRTAPILLSAGIEANTTVESRAAITGTTFPASTTNVFRLTAYSGASAPTTNYQTTYFADQQVNSGAQGVIALNAAQYYPANGAQKLYFYAYAPAPASVTAGSGTTAPVANYTLTGQQDIMAAQVITGIPKVSAGVLQQQPEFQFTHKLKQVKFVVKRDASFENSIAVTSIKVKGVKTTAQLNVIKGTLTFSGSGDLTAHSGSSVTITDAGAIIPGSIMFEPGTSFTVEVIAGGVTYSNIAVALTGTNAGNASVSHTVTLTFKRNKVEPTASITGWTAGMNIDKDVY